MVQLIPKGEIWNSSTESHTQYLARMNSPNYRCKDDSSLTAILEETKRGHMCNSSQMAYEIIKAVRNCLDDDDRTEIFEVQIKELVLQSECQISDVKKTLEYFKNETKDKLKQHCYYTRTDDIPSRRLEYNVCQLLDRLDVYSIDGKIAIIDGIIDLLEQMRKEFFINSLSRVPDNNNLRVVRWGQITHLTPYEIDELVELTD